MVVRRDSLRAQTDFFSPMTGNTSPRLAGAPRGKYGDEVKSRMAGMGEVRSTRTNPIQAAFVELIKTEDPFTEIDTKKSYAPEEEEGLIEALEGVGDGTSDVGERVEEFLGNTGSGGSNALSPERVQVLTNNAIGRKSTQQLVDRDNKRYGNTFPDGAIGINSKSTDDFSKDPRYQSTADPTPDPGTPPQTEETRTYYGQGGLPLGTTTIRQGGQVKDGKFVGPQEKGPAINASGFQQKNVRGSGNPNNTGKDESARPKQTVASLPSNYAATEKKAFEAAKAYKASKADSQAKGDAAAKATGIPSKPPAGSFGISDKGKAQAAVNKAQAQKKSSPSTTKTSTSTSTSKSSPSSSSSSSSSTSTSKSVGRGGRRGGSSGGSGSSSKGGSKGGSSGGSKGGSKGGSSGGSKGGTGRGGSRGGSSGGSGASSKGGVSRGPSRRTNTRRSRRRCDIRTKIDISVLTNMDLLKDDLANVAYFVKELQETN